MDRQQKIGSKEQLSTIEVTEPIRIISPDKAQIEAPEFNFPRNLEVISIGQRQAKFGDGSKPFFTGGITQCELVILQTKNRIPSESQRYGFIHVQSGDLVSNEEGSKLLDIVENISDITTGIMVTGSNSINASGVSRELEDIGVVTAKRISINTRRSGGNTWLYIAYRPETDEILAKVGSDQDFSVPIHVYSGFKDIPITDTIVERSISNRRTALGQIVSKELASRYQDLAQLISEKDFMQARRMFAGIKEYAATHNVDWTKQPKGWVIIEQKLQDGT